MSRSSCEQDPRAHFHAKREECCQLVFEVLDESDSKFGESPEMQYRMPSPATRLRNFTRQLIYTSDDEVFHNTLNHWLHRRGLSNRFLEIDSPGFPDSFSDEVLNPPAITHYCGCTTPIAGASVELLKFSINSPGATSIRSLRSDWPSREPLR